MRIIRPFIGPHPFGIKLFRSTRWHLRCKNKTAPEGAALYVDHGTFTHGRTSLAPYRHTLNAISMGTPTREYNVCVYLPPSTYM